MMGAVPDDLLVTGLPDEVLLRSVTALRRLGARITRYDVDALTLEARIVLRAAGLLRAQPRVALVCLRATASDRPGCTRLAVEAEATSRLPWLAGAGILVRRFTRELTRITTTTP